MSPVPPGSPGLACLLWELADLVRRSDEPGSFARRRPRALPSEVPQSGIRRPGTRELLRRPRAPWFLTPWFLTPWFLTPWFPAPWFPAPWFLARRLLAPRRRSTRGPLQLPRPRIRCPENA